MTPTFTIIQKISLCGMYSASVKGIFGSLIG